MPLYTYYCQKCPDEGNPSYEFERRVKIQDRDGQYCSYGHKLVRKLDFTGSVYSQTANGGMKR